MKVRTMLITILMLSAAGGGACSFGQQPSTSAPPNALTIVVDTSWSCDRYMSDFRTLARQAAGALQPGDYLEFLVARAGSPTIKLATTIKSVNAEEIKSIDAVLATIHARFLSTASIANALEVAFQRLSEVSAKRGVAGGTAIVFTRCEISREEAIRILALADKFSARTWSLYLTGTRNSNREILVGANRHTLRWCSISEANPALWLARNEPEDTAPEKTEAPTPEPKRPEEQPASPPPPEPLATPDKPQDQLAGPGQAQTPPSPGYHISIGSTVEVAPLPQRSHETIPPPPELVLEASEPPGPTLETNKPPGAVAQEPEAEPLKEEVVVPQDSFWAWLKGAFHGYWWLIPLTALLGGFIIVVSKDVVKAGRWDTKRKGHLAASVSTDPGTLVIRYGDQDHLLGPLDRFRSIHIGPGSKNTIKTPGTTERDRHLRLYRHGRDVMLKNLAPSSVMVNGIEVKSGRRHRLVIPSIIQLNDKTKLNLDLVRRDTRPAQTGGE